MLKIEQLSAHFAHSKHFLLQDISFHIAPQQKVALVGESGSGKSMLAQMILRLQNNVLIDSGAIYFHNENLLQCSDKHMRSLRGLQIAYIPQEPLSSLNPLQKVGKQITESLFLHANVLYPNMRGKALRLKAQERCEELLETVGLSPHFAMRYPFELSGGQKQRVAIAMSIVNRPKLLICDEPTTALDVFTQKQIMDMLKHLSSQSAILFISHDLSVVRGFCDSVVVLKDGKLIESRPTNALFTTPNHPYTKFLIESLSLPHRDNNRDNADKQAQVPILLKVSGFNVSVSKKYFFKTTHKSLVSNVNFELRNGEILGIAGTSGSGKSSLALGILRLLHTNGELLIGGANVNTKHLREQIGIVFQDPFSSLSPRLRIGDIIAEALGGRFSQCQDKVLWALESVGLSPHFAMRYPFELSGGQKQRVAIARAIVRKPSILLLDEPTSALDKSSQKHILNLLLTLQKQLGMGYIFITHDLEILRALSDNILILHNGEVIESGRTKAVFTTPKNIYTKRLLEVFFGYTDSKDSTESSVDSHAMCEKISSHIK